MNKRTMDCKAKYEGKEFVTTDGKLKFIIKEFRAANDIIILFPESGIEMRKSLDQIKKGINNPFGNSPIYFSDPAKAYLHCVFPTNQGDFLEIVEVESMKNMHYKFRDEFGYMGVTTRQNIEKGEVRNPYHKNEFGGYLGEGPYTGNTQLYTLWHSLLLRASGGRDRYKQHYTDAQRYDNCMICIPWLNYNVFCDWYVKSINSLNPKYTYEIDKDLLYPLYKNATNGMKIYSPATCCLITHRLNLLITHLNRKGKTDYSIKFIGELKSEIDALYNDNAMDSKTYNALMYIYFNDTSRAHYINANNYASDNFIGYRVDDRVPDNNKMK